jgi:DNA-binding Lrp family transcriptional regulator
MRELVGPGSYRWNVTEPFSSIARKLGVDEETVRRRLRQARQGGILAGFELIPNPHLLGLEAAQIDVDVAREAAKDGVISQLKLVDGVILIVNFHGKGLRAMVYYGSEDELSRKTQLISSICGSKDEVQWKDPFPPCSLRMRDTDWRIFRTLRREARKSPREVAKELRISDRTVRRRLNSMKEGNAFFIIPVPRFDKLASVLCNFRVQCTDQQQKRIVDERVEAKVERIVFSKTTAREFSVFSVLCNNLTEADKIKRRIEEVEGVRDVKSAFSKELILVDDWLYEIIDSRLRRQHDEVSNCD